MQNACDEFRDRLSFRHRSPRAAAACVWFCSRQNRIVGFNLVVTEFKVLKLGFDALAERLHAFTLLVVERFAKVTIDACEGDGQLKSIPHSFDDPPSVRYGQHVQNRRSGLFGQHRNAFSHAISRTSRAIHGKVRRTPMPEVIGQSAKRLSTALVMRVRL